ncbi:MAG TPA: response regulator transcription factor [Anaerolineales bacterium]|nr:response regulator transcription factor [Anaerolineales bacterium]
MENNHPYPLSPREVEILKRMVQGLHNWEIAENLNITQKMVDFHVENILQKMGVENRVQAVVEAIRRGWVEI